MLGWALPIRSGHDTRDRVRRRLVDREALRTLEQEGQVTYLPRRGYFITALEIEDLEEIYELRAVLEARAARHALDGMDDAAVRRIELAAQDCADAARPGDVAAELEANRRFTSRSSSPRANRTRSA
jgi:DNA-binding GntR family transcriptional regulator